MQGNRDEDQQLKESINSGFHNPVVNSVEMSSDGHFLAAVTDNNLVCIWRYAPPITGAPGTIVPSAMMPLDTTGVVTTIPTAAIAPTGTAMSTALAMSTEAVTTVVTDEVGNLLGIPAVVTDPSAEETLIQHDPSQSIAPSAGTAELFPSEEHQHQVEKDEHLP